jgi:hypothetical protein
VSNSGATGTRWATIGLEHTRAVDQNVARPRGVCERIKTQVLRRLVSTGVKGARRPARQGADAGDQDRSEPGRLPGQLGEAIAANGDKPGAIAAYIKAQALVKDPTQKKRIDATLAVAQPGGSARPTWGRRELEQGGRELLRWRTVPGSHWVALTMAMI